MDTVWNIIVRVCKAILYLIVAPCLTLVSGLLITIDLVRNALLDEDDQDSELKLFHKFGVLLGIDDL